MSAAYISINQRQYLELHDIGIGAFSPLAGFMTEDEFASVVETLRLPGGSVFPLPVVLDLTDEQANLARGSDRIVLDFQGQEVGEVSPESMFRCDKQTVAAKVFGTGDVNHPGVEHFLSMGEWFVGGPVNLTKSPVFEFSGYDLTPEQTRSHFAQQGWDTVVGFQTRNVPHRAHEYLLRLGLEMADGLFIQTPGGPQEAG